MVNEAELDPESNRKIMYYILGILQQYAPDGSSQQVATSCYNDVVKTYAHTKEGVKHMTSMLYDGLAYGNWPWVTMALNKK